MSDLIRREDAIELCAEAQGRASTKSELKGISKVWQGLLKLPSAEAVQGWIPIKYHEIMESERKENGYPKDWVYFLDCEMPQDGQEILVQAKNGEIRWDVCYEDDGFSLDSGWDWKDDIIAWMPLPEPYKGGEGK